jgi:1-phosphofructokinase/tagatose 6-phosphate kinase
VTVPAVEAVATIGAGDAFLAGYIAGRYRGQSPVECLRFGVACGAESTQHVGAGILDPATVERLLEGVVAEPMTLPAEVS